MFYYAGLPSGPKLVTRSSTAQWKAPSGPEAYRVIMELRPAGNHALTEVWEDNIASIIIDLLDTMKVKWTSADIVRIGKAEEPSAPVPVIPWIGVMPASLSGAEGIIVASKCRKLLK